MKVKFVKMLVALSLVEIVVHDIPQEQALRDVEVKTAETAKRKAAMERP